MPSQSFRRRTPWRHYALRVMTTDRQASGSNRLSGPALAFSSPVTAKRSAGRHRTSQDHWLGNRSVALARQFWLLYKGVM